MALKIGLGAGRKWACGALLLLSGSCHSSSQSALVHSTFDERWDTGKGLSSEQAHSCCFAAKAVGPADTLRFRYSAQALGLPQHVRLGAQLWLGRSAHQYPPLHVQVWRGNEPIYTKRLWLNRLVWRYEQWVSVSALLNLPPLEPTDELRLWLALNEYDFKVYLDDLTLDRAQ